MRRAPQMLVVAALVMGLGLSASGQMMGPPGQGGPTPPPPGGMAGYPMRSGEREGRMTSHEAPLITIMLEHSQELGLSPDQENRLRDLRTEFSKEWVRRNADIRVAEIELDSLLAQDKWDLAKIEPKVKQIASLQGDLRLARIKTLAAARDVLTPDQLQKLKQVGHRMRSFGRPGAFGPGTPGPGMPGPGVPPGPRY